MPPFLGGLHSHTPLSNAPSQKAPELLCENGPGTRVSPLPTDSHRGACHPAPARGQCPQAPVCPRKHAPQGTPPPGSHPIAFANHRTLRGWGVSSRAGGWRAPKVTRLLHSQASAPRHRQAERGLCRGSRRDATPHAPHGTHSGFLARGPFSLVSSPPKKPLTFSVLADVFLSSRSAMSFFSASQLLADLR